MMMTTMQMIARPLCSGSTHASLAAFRRGFRLSPQVVSRQGLKVILIRHAESTNNVVQRQVEQQMLSGKLSAQEATQEWLKGRVPDPGLSEKGHEESAEMAKHFGPLLKAAGGASLVCSPMKRALETTLPLMKHTGFPCLVLLNSYEVGGIYTIGGENPQAMTAQDVQALHHNFDVSLMPKQGAWNQNQTAKEVPEDFKTRAQSVAGWIKSDETRERAEGKPLVLVLHSTLLDILIKSLLDLSLRKVDTDVNVAFYSAYIVKV